jgi:hypothetical protein
MAAGTWKVFNRAKKYIGNGVHNLSSSAFRITLHTSASNLKSSGSALPLTAYSQLTNEVASGNGYSSSGKALGTVRWTTGASAKQIKFYPSANPIWTGTAGTIPNIKYAVISQGTRLLCYVTLTSSQFTLAMNSTFTIQFAAGGCLTLT